MFGALISQNTDRHQKQSTISRNIVVSPHPGTIILFGSVKDCTGVFSVTKLISGSLSCHQIIVWEFLLKPESLSLPEPFPLLNNRLG